MADYSTLPDGEYRLDQDRGTPIPPQDSWGNLTAAQLIEVKTRLEGMAWSTKNQQVRKSLEQAIAKASLMIQTAR